MLKYLRRILGFFIKRNHLCYLVLLVLAVLPWIRLGIFGNGIWTYWDNIFNFYPQEAFWDSISAVNSVWANFGTQNVGILGGFEVYGLQYAGSILGMSILVADRLTYMLPWILRGIGMFLLLSTIDRSDSRYSLFVKFLASALYQFAPLGDPFSSNISSVTTGTAPIALAIFIRGINSPKWYGYAVLFSIWFSFAAVTVNSLLFIPAIILLYTLVISPGKRHGRRSVGFLGLCVLLSVVSISYFVVPYSYSLVSGVTVGGSGSADAQVKLQSIVSFASTNGLQYSTVGLENSVWAWFPIYTQPIVYLALTLTTIIAYSTLLIRRDRKALFFAVLGVAYIALATTVTYPYFRDFYLFGFHYLYPFFGDPVYFLYGIWFAICTLLGLGGAKLFSLLSRRKKVIAGMLLIGLIFVDSLPIATGAIAEYTVSPIDGYPIPSDYYELHSLLSNAQIGSRLLEVPLPNTDFACYGVTSPGFTWAGSPGCFNTWLSKLLPRQIESIEDMNLLQPIGYQAVYENLRVGALGSKTEQQLMTNLNVKYIFVHKDLVGEPGWVNQLISELNVSSNFSLITSNQYFNLYQVDYPTSPLYVVGRSELSQVNGAIYQQCAQPECGLVGFWPITEGNGTQVYDLSGNGNTGTLVNSPNWMSGADCKFGNCLNFSSVSSQYVVTSRTTDFPTGSAQRSVFTWIYQTPVSQAKDVLGYGVSATGQSFDLSEASDGSVYFSGWDCDVSTGVPLSVNTWHFIGAVYNGGTSLTIYQDGVAYPEKLPCILNTGTNSMFYLGKGDLGTDFAGRINSVFVYNYALTPSEANGLYSSSPTSLEGTASTGSKPYMTTLEPSTLSEWNAKIDISAPGAVILTQVFSNQWRASIDGRPLPESSHFLVNGYANGWYVNVTGIHSLSIRNLAQPYFYVGAWISAVYWIVSSALIALIILWERRSHKTPMDVPRD